MELTYSAFDESHIAENYPSINDAANRTLDLMGPQLTRTDAGHIQTDIAAAGCLAGLKLLRTTVSDLDSIEPGTIVISDIHAAQNDVLNFMMAVASNMGIEPAAGWGDEVLANNQPMLTPLAMTQKLEVAFDRECRLSGLSPLFQPHAAALAAIKLVAAGESLGLLPAEQGKAIAFYHVVAGSKTSPHPLPSPKGGLRSIRDRMFASFKKTR